MSLIAEELRRRLCDKCLHNATKTDVLLSALEGKEVKQNNDAFGSDLRRLFVVCWTGMLSATTGYVFVLRMSNRGCYGRPTHCV